MCLEMGETLLKIRQPQPRAESKKSSSTVIRREIQTGYSVQQVCGRWKKGKVGGPRDGALWRPDKAAAPIGISPVSLFLSLYLPPYLTLSQISPLLRLSSAVRSRNYYQPAQMCDSTAVIHAYRHLYRQGLKVVNYSTPSRHVLLENLRSSFRTGTREQFEPQKIANTLQFLKRASDVAGLEHKIVRNLLIVHYWEQPRMKKEYRKYIPPWLGLS